MLCIDPFAGIYRVPGLLVSDQGGVAALPIPFAQLISQLGFSPGTPWRFQLWFRDSVGAGMNLSDAAAALFCP